MDEIIKEKKAKEKSFTRVISNLLLKLIGWRAVGEVPKEKKYVMIGYPHTSNWDTLIGLLVFRSLGVHLHWLGKQSLFKGPVGWLLKKTGGVPINRQSSQNFVQQSREIFDRFEHFVLTLSPEGTRKKTDFWRTGFYYIALAAKVPIALAFLDYPKKTGGFGPLLWPSGDIEADMATIRAFYRDIHGKYPEKEGVIRIRPKDQANDATS